MIEEKETLQRPTPEQILERIGVDIKKQLLQCHCKFIDKAKEKYPDYDWEAISYTIEIGVTKYDKDKKKFEEPKSVLEIKNGIVSRVLMFGEK